MSKLGASREDVLSSARLESGGSVRARFFSLFPRGWHRWHSWDGRTSQVYSSNLVFILTILLLTMVGGKGMSTPLISLCPRKTRRLWLRAVVPGNARRLWAVHWSHRIAVLGRGLWPSPSPTPLLKARSPRAGCSKPGPVGFSTPPNTQTPRPLWASFPNTWPLLQ